MKRLSFLFGLLILIIAFVPVYAVDFQAEIDNVPLDLTTTHNVPFDETFTISNPGGDAITNVGAVDENENPIGTITYNAGLSFDWFFEPPCAWVTDGLTHTVSFYLEDATQGYVYPDVALYTSALIVTAGEAPIISGACGWQMLGSIAHTSTAEFEVTSPNSGEIYWSYVVSPSVPVGNVELIDGVLSYSPCPMDEIEGFFIFTVVATNCLGEYDACDVEIEIISCCPIYYHDPNGDGNFDILDIVFVINHKYKDGPAPVYPPSADWDLDGTINILDIVYMISFKYKDGPHPKHNYSTCSGKALPTRGCL